MKEYIVEYETEQLENSTMFYGGKIKRELIRCKDCVYYVIDELKRDGTEDKRYSPSVCLFRISRDSPDWYCADAERRGEDAKRKS